MKRNLKALGLAMVAAFALSGVAVSQALATNHHVTTAAPAIITAEDHVNTKFTADGETVTCTTTKYEGTVTEETSTEVTVTPTYSGCTIAGIINATVDINHCAYVLTGNTNLEGDAEVHLECAEGNAIEITYSVFGSSCKVKVKPTTYEGGVHYTQTENATTKKQDVTIGVTVRHIHWEKSGGAFCPNNGGTGHDGELHGAVTAQAYEDKCSNTLTGTAKTTPGSHYNDCEGAAQDLKVTTT